MASLRVVPPSPWLTKQDHFSKNTCQEACLPQPPPMQPDPLQLLTQVSLPFPFLSPQVKSAGTQF